MRKIASMNPTGRALRARWWMSRNQRGIAMVIALMVLTSLSVLTLLFIASASVDRRMGGDSVTKSRRFTTPRRVWPKRWRASRADRGPIRPR